jgi:flavin reductase (DIM6/NTAB) family NADH-FMN oxidoreductase RutF
VHLGKQNLTHDLVLGSGALAIHLLPRDEAGLELFRALGLASRHKQRKLDGFEVRTSETGCPVLADAVAYLEGRAVKTLHGDELTVVLADVVAAGRAADLPYLTIEDVRERLPAEAMREWARRYEAEVEAAHRLRWPGGS